MSAQEAEAFLAALGLLMVVAAVYGFVTGIISQIRRNKR